MERVIMHIDVNNAFLSWTAVDLLQKGFAYDIRNSYAVIGGDEKERRGVVIAKSNPCKKLGIKTADTLYSARKKCPILKVYKADYSLYKKMSDSLFTYIQKYTPDIEVLSIDECFIDYTPVQKLYGDPLAFAHRLKDEIEEKLLFTVNIGIASNKLCAKMASDFEKPNKVHTLFESEIEKKMWPLPVEKLYGVGKKSSKKLKQMKINTIKDLAHADENKLYPYFKNSAHKWIESANGKNEEKVNIEKKDPKAIGNSTTLSSDIEDIKELKKIVLSMSENVAGALQKQNKYANTVSVQIKDKFFKCSSHQRKLQNAIRTSKEIYEVSIKLFEELWKQEPIRLLGIRLDNLTTSKMYQVSLFENIKNVEDDRNLDSAIASLKQKYGCKIIEKGSLVDSKIHKKYNE